MRVATASSAHAVPFLKWGLFSPSVAWAPWQCTSMLMLSKRQPTSLQTRTHAVELTYSRLPALLYFTW